MSSSISLSVLLFLLLVFFSHHCHGSSKIHIVYMGHNQHSDHELITDSHHDLLASVVGSKETAAELMVYSYRHGFSGFAAKLTESQAQKLAELPGVVRVIPNTVHRLQTTRSWDFLSLSSHSPDNVLQNSSLGDGVIIGILDTGIWPESKSFSEKGLGKVPNHWKGVCDSGTDKDFNCNKKIIGARWYLDGFLAEYGQPLNTSDDTQEFLSPRDANGHGTHTSSTAAGSLVSNISYNGLARGAARGGAPRARLSVYKVCWNVLGGQCASADILKAFDDAIHDGVDVLSVSIGSSIPLFSDVDERDGIATGSFHAVSRGITVVCGAANDGPAAQTVQNTAPWVLTVAATTMDRAFPTAITLGNNRTLMGEAIYSGKETSFTGLIYPETKGINSAIAGECQSLSLNDSSTAGKVVLCFSSATRRVSILRAADVVKQSGGVGLIVARNPSDALSSCDSNFPCVDVDYEIGTKILFYIRSTRLPKVRFSTSRTIIGKPISAKVAFFSSRGPNSIAPAILKPDIAAPGANILAATSPLDDSADGGYAMHSGTSMATPHVSGIVALLKALHPNWSPAAIRSALVTSGRTRGSSGLPIFAEGSSPKPANPFDFGGGIADPNAAADPGLVYDMNTTDYIHYLCAVGYNDSAVSRLTAIRTQCPNPKPSLLDLNHPSITIPNLQDPVTLTRTVTNVGLPISVYKVLIEPPLGTEVSVHPDVLVFSALNQKVSFRVRVSSRDGMNSGFFFGSLTWISSKHAVRIPLSVRTDFLQAF